MAWRRPILLVVIIISFIVFLLLAGVLMICGCSPTTPPPFDLTQQYITQLNATTFAEATQRFGSTQTPELYNIVWSTQDIPCGTLITDDMVALIPTPLDSIPSSPTLRLEQVVGKYTMQHVPANVQVFPTAFSDTPLDC
jgi:Flp pilus assembly protein CpaB